MKKVRYINKHILDCYAVEATQKGLWTTPWYFVKKVNGDARGSIDNGHKYWLMFDCNNFDCSAQVMLLAESVILDLGISI